MLVQCILQTGTTFRALIHGHTTFMALSQPRLQSFVSLRTSGNQSFSVIISRDFSTVFFQGDVQTASTMLVVLGDEIRNIVDENDQEQWLTSYIGLS